MLTKKTFFTRFLIFAIAMGFAFSSYGETITAVSDGDWNDEDTWDLGRLPENGDKIIIPSGLNIFIFIYSDLTGPEATTITISGTLILFGAMVINGNDGDGIIIENGGEIQGAGGIYYDNFSWRPPDFPIPGGGIQGPATISNTPLPVELLSFEAQPSFNSVKISWSTATEKNNDYFTLERSKDGINFETMETVYGAGTTNEVQHYEVVDESPLYGWSYYRLSQTDYDGTTEVFDPVTVEFAPEISKPELAVYPNPVVHDNFTAKISGDFNADYAQIELYDLNGNRVLSERHPLQSGKFLNAEVYLRSGLQAGYYIVRVHVAGQTFASRIMKN